LGITYNPIFLAINTCWRGSYKRCTRSDLRRNGGIELLLVGVGVEEAEELELLVIELELDVLVEEDEVVMIILDELDEEVVTEVELVDDMLDEQEPSVVVSHGGTVSFQAFQNSPCNQPEDSYC